MVGWGEGRWRQVADRAALPAVVVLTAWVTLPFLRPDRWVTAFDTIAYSGPNLAVTHEAIRDLRLPEWNPEIFGGATHLGNPQAAVLDPLAWLVSPLPLHRAMAVMTVVRLAVLASGMWWLTRRRMALVPPAAAIATMAAVGSGLVMARSLQFEQIAVVSWVPWILVGCDVAIARARWSGVIWAALPMAAAAVSGHPQQLYLAVPLAGAWCAGRILDGRAGWPAVGRLAAAGALAGALAAPQLVPALAAMSESAISESRSLAETEAYMVGIRQIPLLLLGDVGASDHPLSAGTFEGLAFVGVPVLALAALAVIDRARPGRATRLALLAAGLFGLLCAIGPRLPVYRVLYRIAPGFDLARVPGRWMLLPVIALALLSGLGTDRLLRGKVDPRTAAAAVGLLSAAVAAAIVLDRASPRGTAWWLLGTVLVAALVLLVCRRPTGRGVPGWVALALIVLVVAELGVASNRSLARKHLADQPFDELGSELVADISDDDGLVVALTLDRLDDPAYLVAGLRPNTNAVLGVASLDGYDGGVQVTHRWADAVAALATTGFDPEVTLRSQLSWPVDPDLAARLGVRWLLVDHRAHAPAEVAPGWSPVGREGTLTLLENPRWQARAVLYRRSEHADDLVAALRGAPSDAAVVDRAVELECRGACGTDVGVVRSPRPERLTVSFPPADVARLLVVDVQAAEGWTAEVDGRGSAIVRANGMFIGVEVPPGAEQVDLRYVTPGLRLGLLGTLGGNAVALGGWGLDRRRRRPPADPTEPDPQRAEAATSVRGRTTNVA